MSDDVRDAITASMAGLTRLVRAPAAEGYGTDLACLTDLDPRMLEASGIDVLAQDLYHRITTPRGQVPDTPGYGTDVTAYLNRGTEAADLAVAAGAIVSELKRDDRVSHATATLTPDPTGKALAVVIDVEPEASDLGTFRLILSVDGSGVTLTAVESET
jgi:hypothetical protein